jgi:hypothetical protein
VFVLDCPRPCRRAPLVVLDTSGFWLRPHGPYYIGGVVPPDDEPDLPLEPDLAQFEEDLRRHWRIGIPAFEALKVVLVRSAGYQRDECLRPQRTRGAASRCR